MINVIHSCVKCMFHEDCLCMELYEEDIRVAANKYSMAVMNIRCISYRPARRSK